MIFEKVKTLLFLFVILFISFYSTAQTAEKQNNDETLQMGIQILKRYFYEDNKWFITKPSVAKDVKGLINFIEDDPIDSVINNIYKTFSQKQTYVFRLPENVDDSLSVPGYYPINQVSQSIGKIGFQLQKEFEKKQANIPPSVFTNLEERLNLVPQGKGMQLFSEGIYKMPKDLQIPDVIPDSVINSPEEFQKLVRIDNDRAVYVEQKRIHYNDSIVSAYTDSVKNIYGQKAFEQEYNYRVRRYTDSVKVNNYNVLRLYNESVVNSVNDSISAVLQTIADYADFIDSTKISMYNLTGDSSEIKLKSGDEKFARFWLKNVQNDSLSVLVRSVGKHGMFMLIDDGVTISRYKPKETKDFDFRLLEKNISALKPVGKSYEVETPWIIGGEGNVGFTQTYLQNWKKGGQSALSSLIVMKGFANYRRADGIFKWDNSGEFRNGWIRPGGKEEQIQKNDDKFEITSRFGLSAFKKWYYSSEFDFETQFFKGYEYPRETDEKPISAFMAPSRIFFKMGMEYKPNKDFSLLLSPFTIKNVYVRDTTLIDQTKFGIDADKKSFWEPGLNADLYFKRSITENISYETKYKMFINYKEPFQKFDVNWENLFVMKVTNYVNMRFLVHFIYDDNVLFPVYDANEVQIGEKPKLQIREFFSVGFTYKINHNVQHSKRLR
jgi:hypothetical protein